VTPGVNRTGPFKPVRLFCARFFTFKNRARVTARPSIQIGIGVASGMMLREMANNFGAET